MKRFGLSRQAASRQLSRHIMPMFLETKDWEQQPQPQQVVGDDEDDDDGGGKQPAVETDAIGQQQQQQQLIQDQQHQPAVVVATTTTTTTALPTTINHQQQQQTNTIQQPPPTTIPTPKKRSIVISGVTSGLGRALLGYYSNQGHYIAGCGRRLNEIQSLQLQYPHAKLSVVDVSCDVSVGEWAASIFNSSGDEQQQQQQQQSKVVVDLVIANAGISPETIHQSKCAWEVPRQDFDSTIDVNVKGVSNMIRHFVPHMLTNTTPTSTGGTGGTFVAMSSGLGRSPNPYHAAYCSSKWAVEGMMKSLAMSFPVESGMCAVPLAPGIVQTENNNDNDKFGGVEASLSSSSSTAGNTNNLEEWVKVAGPMILGLSRKDNGKSLSVKGFYSLRYRQSWSFPDGSGIPDQGGVLHHSMLV